MNKYRNKLLALNHSKMLGSNIPISVTECTYILYVVLRHLHLSAKMNIWPPAFPSITLTHFNF
jgi:hypothetical protein